MKSYEVINQQGKSHYYSAKNKKQVLAFLSEKPKKIIVRKDIDAKSNFQL